MFKLIVFELQFHRKQWLFWLLTVLAFIGGMTMFYLKNQGAGIVHDYAPYQWSLSISLMSLVATFAAMLLAVNAVIRDRKVGMTALVYSTAIQKHHFFISRFLGMYVLVMLLSLLGVLGFACGQFLPTIDAEALTTIQWLEVAWPSLLFLVLNGFIISTIVFAIALFTQQVPSTYVGGVLLFSLFWISSFYINSPMTGGQVLSPQEVLDIGTLVDPYGISAFFEQTQFWTIHQKNNQAITLVGNLLTNRVLWLSLSVCLLVISYQHFSFRKMASSKVKQAKKRKKLAIQTLVYEPVSLATNTAFTQYLKLKTLVIAALKSILLSLPFQALMGIWTILMTSSFYFMINGEERFGPRYPTTHLIAGLIAEVIPLFSALLLVFYSGELVWRSRERKFHELIDSLPVSNKLFFVSNYLVIVLLLLILMTIPMLIAIIYQLALEYYQIDLIHYLSLYYYFGMQALLYGIFALFIQSISPHKYVGMIVTSLVLLVFGPFRHSLGIEHVLGQFNQLPAMARAHSHFTGYGQYAKAFHWRVLYWMIVAGMLTLISFKYWRRGTGNQGLHDCFRLKWERKEKLTLWTLISLFVAVGGGIFHQTNVLNDYISEAHQYDFNEAYERKFKQYEHLAIPQIIDIKTEVAFYPDELRYTIKGNYRIQNQSKQAIDSIFISSPLPYADIELENARLLFHDVKLNSYLFQLITPLAVHDSLQLQFVVEQKTKGFAISKTILENGSYLKHSSFDPLLAYADFLEINDPKERSRRGLEPQSKEVFRDKHLDFSTKFNRGKVHFETLLSTSENQLAFSSGKLLKEWKEGERNYYQFKTTDKVHGNMAYFSARYASKIVDYQGIKLAFYYHPDHGQNIEEMLRATKATIAYCQEQFGDYPHDYLRIAEIPTGVSFGGQAMPGVISMVETAMYTKDVRDPNLAINVVARRTIHEVAHQWWGHLLSPKEGKGAKVLTESLAKYTEAVVLEKEYGRAMVQRLTDYTQSRYFSGRAYAQTTEPALYLAGRQNYLTYSKGYLVFLALRDVLSEAKMNVALKQLIQRHGEASTATTSDLIAALNQVADSVQQRAIHDWMKRVLRYDLRVENVAVQALENGNYQLDFAVIAHRWEMQESGEELEIELNEAIQIGVFDRLPKNMQPNEQPIELQYYPIHQGENRFSIIINQLPRYLAIDPYFTRLDQNRRDNIIVVEE